MKLKASTLKSVAAGAAVILLLPAPGHALFGIGDIVFDPTSYAQLISQLATLKQQYTMLENNIAHFSVKQQWQTVRERAEAMNVANRFGETSGMTAALNTNSPAASSTAWNMSTVRLNISVSPMVAGQTPGSSDQMAQLSYIEASDAISPNCLSAVGQYHGQIAANTAANGSLSASQMDGGTGSNSEVQQLNLLNAGQNQQMTELQAQGNMQACLAAETALSNMAQRNAAASLLNDEATAKATQAANPVYPGNESNTWDSYVP